MKLRQILHILVFLLSTSGLHAEIKIPSIFGNHMVLQQKAYVALWGSATPGKTVRIKTSWDEKNYSVQANNSGDWKIKVKTHQAGGPYEITISDGSVLKLTDVLIGEVWLCSGQSNMEMPMKGFWNQSVINSNEIIATSENSKIRLFTVENNKSLDPLDDFRGTWKECVPENVANFSATAYYFGKMMQQILKVPVGLINASWGGTRIEPWISRSGLKSFDWVTVPDNNEKGEFSPQTPSVLFNAMIHPMVGYGIRGLIWYQGESNRNEPDHYRELLTCLVENWRNKWDIGEFPFYYVQIAPFDYGVQGTNSAFFREAQLKVSDAIPNCGMACIMDTGEKNNVHPTNKKVVGDRLAYLALGKTYNKKGFAYYAPVLKEMNIEGSNIYLTFDYANNGLTSLGRELQNFKVAGENKRFYPAKAVISKQGITLFSPYVEKPMAVRYAFEDFVVGDLFNTEGLPASSFRTDNWEQ